MAAGVSRAQIYRWRTEDLQFANDWDEAYEIGSDVIEDAAYQRAVVGIETTIVTKDGKEITKTEYSDRLGIAPVDVELAKEALPALSH
jgi:hypothetical protein